MWQGRGERQRRAVLGNRILLTILMGILLSGCAGPAAVFKSPEIDLPDRYSMMAPIQRPNQDDLEWWRNLNDPVLNQLVSRGMTGNLSIADAQARLRESEAILRREGVAATGTGTADITASSRSSERFDTGVNAQVNLAGETRHRTAAAQARYEAAALNEVEARRIVLQELSNAYVDLRFFQTIRYTRGQDLASRQRTLRDVKTQLEAGEATKLDLLRAQSLLAETRAEIPGVEASIIRQRNRLSTLLGVPVGSLALDLRYAGSQPSPKRIADLGVPADLLRARSDIQRAERIYAAAVSDVGAAQAARYPSLRLSGLISAPFSGGSTAESLVAGLVVPVFTQPALAADVDTAQARVQQAYLQWRVAVLGAVEEVENAQALLHSALQAASASRDAVELNRQSLDLSRKLISSGGNITILDILDRERALSASRTTLASNLRDVAAGYIALRVALGQGHPLLVEDVATRDIEVSRATAETEVH